MPKAISEIRIFHYVYDENKSTEEVLYNTHESKNSAKRELIKAGCTPFGKKWYKWFKINENEAYKIEVKLIYQMEDSLGELINQYNP